MSGGPEQTQAESSEEILRREYQAEIGRLRAEIERRAAENARLQDGLSRLVMAIYAVYEQAQGAMRKPSP